MVAEKVRELEQENIVLKAQVEKLQDICSNRVELPVLQELHSALYERRR